MIGGGFWAQDRKVLVPKVLALGLWAGALFGSTAVVVNAARYEEFLPGSKERATLQAMFVCGVCAPLGWALWAGFIIKPDGPPESQQQTS